MANRRKPNPAQVLGPPAPVVTPPAARPADTLGVQGTTPEAQSALVLKRQNELLAHGYQVAADGVWGDQSQQAWSHYIYWKRRGTPFHGLDLTTDRAKNLAQMFGTASDQAVVQQAHDQAAAPVAAKKAARAAVKALTTGVDQIAHPDTTPAEAAAVVKKAAADKLTQDIDGWKAQVRTNPQSAGSLTLTQLAQVIGDDRDPVPATSPEGATAIQVWLSAHGYKVNPSGQFDQQTHDAIQHAFQDQTRREHAKQVDALVTQLYKPYGLTAGDTANWMPTLDRRIPEPADLLALLQHGGVTAMAVEKALREHVIEPQAFDHLKLAQLVSLAFKMGLISDERQIMHQPISATEARDYLLAASNDKVFQAEVLALYRSRNPGDFKTQLANIVKQQEADKKKHDSSWMSQTLRAFSEAAHYALKPGEWTRQEIVKDAMDVGNLADYLGGIATNPYDGLNPTSLQTATDADAAAFIHGLPAYLRIPFEMVVDPLNFFAPFKLTSTALRISGFKAFGGYVLKESAELSLEHSEGLIAKAFGLKFEKGTWSKLAIPKAIDKHVLGGTVAASKPIKVITHVADKATAIKPDVIKKVRHKAVIASRHLYTAPKTPLLAPVVETATHAAGDLVAHAADKAAADAPAVVEQGLAAVGAAVKGVKFKQPALDLPTAPKEIVAAARKGRDAVKVVLEKHPRYQHIVKALQDANASIYVDANLTVHSSVGASLIARHAEEARIQVTHQIAQDVHDRVLWFNSADAWKKQADRLQQQLRTAHANGDAELKRHATRSVVAHAKIMEQKGAHLLSHAEAEKLAAEEYAKVIESVASHIKGGFDHALTFVDGEVTKNVLAEIRRRQSAIMDRFETTILPALHELVQDAADQSGRFLWDASGHWIANGDLEQRILRDLGQQAFDPHALVEVTNPAHAIGHTVTEMQAAIEDEVVRATNRIYWRAARDRVVGDATIDVEKRVEEIRKDIQSHWHKRDGKWFDDRPSVKVPDFYVRHLRESLGSTRPAHGGLGELAQGSRHSGPLDEALASLVWDLGGRTKVRGAYLDYGTRRMPAKIVDQATADAAESDFRAASELHDAVTLSQAALAKGYDYSVSKGFVQEWAFMLALAHAQSAPMRATYRGLKRGLDTWIFVTLPLRPGWVARNVADNIVKTFMAGVRDPRLFFQGFENPRAAEAVHSVFGANIAHVRGAVGFLDGLMGTDALSHFDTAVDEFWKMEGKVIGSIFNAHGVDVNEGVIDAMRPNLLGGETAGRRPLVPQLSDDELRHLYDQDPKLAQTIHDLTKQADHVTRGKWVNAIWHLMGSMPEDYFKRILYRDTVKKTLKTLEHSAMSDADKQLLANGAAVKRIETFLFDYSKVSITEDNFRLFYPFIQFWRKNTTFWLTSFVNHPWLPADIQKWENERADANKDWPSWMKRYVSVGEVVDAAAVIPGLAPVVKLMLPDNAMADPLNFTSFGKLYKIIKGENPDLPPDKQGWKIIGPMIDYMDSFGPGSNPLWRKPLESAGIASMQAWKTVIPEFGPALALTRDWWTTQHTGPEEWARIIGLAGMGVSSDRIAKDFDYWVNMEVVGQQARGEPVDRKAAAATVKKWFILQNLYGYFTGTYFRRANPQDIYLSKLWEQVTQHQLGYDKLTPQQQSLMNEWAKRKMSRQQFMEYVSLVPIIEAYFRQPSFAAAEAYKQAHPEIMQYVDTSFSKKGPFASLAKSVNTAINTDEFFKITGLYDSLDVSHDVMESATQAMLTPALKKSWDKNRTPAHRRKLAVQAELHKQLQEETDAFFQIPANDYKAKAAFLEAHPELGHAWISNNSLADDFGGLLHGANAELRTQVFAMIDAKDYDGVDKFLAEHPWIWEDTKKAYEFDPKTGQKKLMYLHGKARDTAVAKPDLDIFFQLLHKVGKKKAFAWLYGTHGKTQDAVKEYFRKYGKHPMDEATQHAFDVYDTVPKNQRDAWFRAKSPEAQAVKAYWYAHATPTQRKQQDAMDYWASLPKKQAAAWLHGGSDKANIVRRFLWSHSSPEQHKVTLALNYYNTLKGDKKIAWRYSGDPRAKLIHDFFWKHMTPAQRQTSAAVDHYFKLPKAKRADWMHGNDPRAKAVKHFFWQHETPAERQTSAAIDHYFSLPKDKRVEFMHGGDARAKLVRQFFVKHSTPEQRKTSSALDHYFTLAKDKRTEWMHGGDARAALVKEFFWKHSTPEQRKVSSALDHYFTLAKDKRTDWMHGADPRAKLVKDFFFKHSTPAQRETSKALDHYFSLDDADKAHYLDNHFSHQADLVNKFFLTHESATQKQVRLAMDQYKKIAPENRGAWLHDGSPAAKLLLKTWRANETPAEKAQREAVDYYRAIKDPAKRRAWLNGPSTQARLARNSFAKLDLTRTHRAVDYLRVKPLITAFRKMPAAERQRFLYHGKTEAAQQLRDYFDRWGRNADADTHALDYYEVKDQLDAYGKMTKDQRRVFLASPDGDKLLAYFKKYSKVHQYEAAFYKAHPDLINGTPEQYQRLMFWKQYFALTPDQRPSFIDDNADAAGVFIYGAFSEREMRDKANDFHRYTGKLTAQQGAYLYAKPLIDFYYTLPADQRSFFLRVNPEVADYFEHYAKGKIVDDPKLNAKLETYFKMAPYGTTRTTYLEANPDVKQYFDKHQNPQQRAIHQLLDFYFALPVRDRGEFADKHPELGAFFDRQKAARDSYERTAQEFDKNDPRLSPYFEKSQSLIDEAAWERGQLRQAAINALSPEGITAGHGERQPYKASTSKHGDSRGKLKKLPDGWIQSGRQRTV